MAEIDLNLLKIFDALIELRSVTRVADRLGLTQSAVSHALGRLRRMLDDPLFVRGPRGLQPSARAEQIAPGIRLSLQQLRDALAPAEFAPSSAARSFVIAAGSYFCTLLVPLLVERLRNEAPNITLRVVPLIEDGTAMLDRGLIDLALTGVETLPTRFVVEPLFDEELVWIAGAAPSAGPMPSIAEMMTRPRVHMKALQRWSPMPRLHDDADLLAEEPTRALVEVTSSSPAIVYDSVTATSIVARTNMIACVPRRIAERAAGRGEIRILAPTASEASVGIAMTWHGRNRTDAALVWFRALILDLATAPCIPAL
jgi:DNA-binding transcriptional LysR family regulator